MPNGKRYFVIPRNVAAFENLRMDSLGNLYAIGANFLPKDSIEVLALKYDAKPGDHWIMAIDTVPFLDTIMCGCLSVKTGNVFGKIRKIKEIMIYNSYMGNYPILTYFYADGIGIVREEGWEGSVCVLKYAKIDGVTYGQLLDVKDKSIIPEEFSLLQNYPNPFNPSTTIRYALPGQSHVEVKIYNIIGNEVRSFTMNSQSAGYHNLKWDGKNSDNEQVISGIYIYRLKAVSYENGKVFEKSAKMTFVK